MDLRKIVDIDSIGALISPIANSISAVVTPIANSMLQKKSYRLLIYFNEDHAYDSQYFKDLKECVKHRTYAKPEELTFVIHTTKRNCKLDKFKRRLLRKFDDKCAVEVHKFNKTNSKFNPYTISHLEVDLFILDAALLPELSVVLRPVMQDPDNLFANFKNKANTVAENVNMMAFGEPRIFNRKNRAMSSLGKMLVGAMAFQNDKGDVKKAGLFTKDQVGAFMVAKNHIPLNADISNTLNVAFQYAGLSSFSM
jgi:hypothetical protein